jgi:rfaE bifunctional protein nucleotidyltransferase chain/domain
MSTEVLVTGTFNVLHAGHCELLEFASRLGRVTVGINADPYLVKKYGDKAIPLNNRAYVLKCNRFVDEVVFFKEDNPAKLIKKLKPKYFVRGPDYAGVELPEQDALDSVGAKVVIHRVDKIHSSTEIVSGAPSSWFESIPGLELIPGEAVVED